VVSNELHVVFVTQFKFVVIQSCFVGDLAWNELGMVSGWNALVNVLSLVQVLNQICEYKLSHFDVVCENVYWEMSTFGDGEEFLFFVVWLWWICFFIFFFWNSTAVEWCQWCNPFDKSLIIFDILQSNSNLLSIVKAAQIKSVVHRIIKLELMEQESIVMVRVQKIKFAISVAETFHLLESRIGKTNLRNEGLESFTHHKHWEVITLLLLGIGVLVVDVLKNGAECFLEFSVSNSFVAVTSNVDTVDFVQHGDNLLIWVKERNWNNNNSTLFKELNVSFWDIWNIFSDFKYFSSVVFASHISSEWFSENTINRPSIVTNINNSIFPISIHISIFWSECITDLLVIRFFHEIVIFKSTLIFDNCFFFFWNLLINFLEHTFNSIDGINIVAHILFIFRLFTCFFNDRFLSFWFIISYKIFRFEKLFIFKWFQCLHFKHIFSMFIILNWTHCW